jgi:hypothetical protein
MSAIKFYLVIEGQRKGPFALEELPEHGLEYDTLVWHTGLGNWYPARELPALRDVLLTIPPPIPDAVPVPRDEPERSSPETFRSLYLPYAILFAAIFVLPVLGGFCLAAAQTERYPVTYNYSGRVFTHYRYSDLGEVLLVVGGLTIGGCVLPLIGAIVLFSLMLFKTWGLVQDGYTSVTPGKAVGLLFVPFYNFYWVFVAVHGLAAELAHYPRRHGGPYDLTPPSQGLTLTFCILFICCWVPFVGFLTLLPALIVWFVVTTQMKNAAVVILEARQPPAVLPDMALSRTAITHRPVSAEGI